ncbi:Glutamate synthase [NADPH] large chain precursor [Providencia stuartii]|nr:Glutamate synthase [NADPH] large chain precursor [Providencia stuartii]
MTKLTDLIGRTDLLEIIEGTTAKQSKINLQSLLATSVPQAGTAVFCTEKNPSFDEGLLNQRILRDAEPYLAQKTIKNLFLRYHEYRSFRWCRTLW